MLNKKFTYIFIWCIFTISPLLSQSLFTSVSFEIEQPHCHNEQGFLNLKSSLMEDIEYSFDNRTFQIFKEQIEVPIGDYQVFIRTESEFEILDFSIKPTDEISFDFLEINPADCNGENGRIRAAVSASNSENLPLTGSGTIFINTVEFANRINERVDAGEYTLTAFLNENIRIDTIIQIPFGECEVYFPNAIYPNSTEGLNKRFVPGFSTGANPNIMSFLIYDKWGSLIYKKENIDIFQFDQWWDGQCNGQACEKGTYSYRVKINFGGGNIEEQAGTIQVF